MGRVGPVTGPSVGPFFPAAPARRAEPTAPPSPKGRTVANSGEQWRPLELSSRERSGECVAKGRPSRAKQRRRRAVLCRRDEAARSGREGADDESSSAPSRSSLMMGTRFAPHRWAVKEHWEEPSCLWMLLGSRSALRLRLTTHNAYSKDSNACCIFHLWNWNCDCLLMRIVPGGGWWDLFMEMDGGVKITGESVHCVLAVPACVCVFGTVVGVLVCCWCVFI